MITEDTSYRRPFWSGEFADPNVERQYWSETWPLWSMLTRYAALFLGVLLLGLIVLQGDLQTTASSEHLRLVVVFRVVAILLFAGVILITFLPSTYYRALQTAIAAAMVGFTVTAHFALVIYGRNFDIFIINHLGLLVFIYMIFRNRAGFRLFNGAVMFIAFIIACHYAKFPAYQSLLMPTLISAGMNTVGFFASRWWSGKLRADFHHQLTIEQERARAVDKLVASEREMRAILDNLADTFYRTDGDGRMTMISPSVVELSGYHPDELMGQRLAEYYVDPNDREDFLRQLADGHGQINGFEARIRTKSGSEVWASTSARYHHDDQGNVAGVEGIVRNITERKQFEQALGESESRFRTLAEATPTPTVIRRLSDAQILYGNQATLDFLGWSQEQLVGQTSTGMWADPAQRTAFLEELNREGKLQDFKAQFKTSDGNLRWMLISAELIDFQGEAATFSSYTDITELLSMEEQLRQAQKMEAVGQLTGGIAHDFNNILAVIVGNLSLLQDSSDINDEFDKECLATSLRATLRGAELTHRLLAFSRQQDLSAKTTRINEILPHFCQLAQSTIGEDITIEIKPADDLWTTVVDAGQLENALLNLAINARDAMPKGGHLIIETANRVLGEDYASEFDDLVPGDYVTVTVSDDGAGMPEDVRARVFDPFFTTKDVGEGSGLGLSMVFGFAQQSGGQASIYSEEGEGTTVRIYLPKENAAEKAESTAEVGSLGIPTGDETILVVEDDRDVLSYLVTILGRLGYTVLEATDGPAALEVMAASSAIDLLLTDMILPRGMNGHDVATAFRQHYPAAGVLYSSGYTREVLNRRGRLADDAALMNKPYQTPALARRVRDVLDGRK